MGNDVSKEINDIVDVLEAEGKTCMTPTSNMTSCAYIDPRSPTEGIMRTPIEVRRVLEQSENVYSLRRRWKSESELTPVEHSCKDPYYLLLNDPRSPTLGIARTPIQIPYGRRECETTHNSNDCDSVLQNTSTVMDVPDCRSPSSGICRTPVQVTATGENEIIKELSLVEHSELSSKTKSNTDLSVPWHTPVSKRAASPSFVYTDKSNSDIRGKTDIKVYEPNSVHEKENDASLKRKLKFTPEQLKTAVKMRTPLGSRCNFQDSPSQYLKIMQVQKVDEELGTACENASSNHSVTAKSTKRAHSVVEWDNKDATLIM